MTTRRIHTSLLFAASLLSLAALATAGCSDDADPIGDGGVDETDGDGDGDPDPTGDGDPDPTGDGDGDPDPTGDGDPDPTTGDGDPDPSTGDGDVEDTTPPTVVMTSPGADAAGVLPEAVIEIEFSEAMDKASVQSAWQSIELPSDAVTFAWNPEGTVLTVTPNDPLVIAEIAAIEDPGQSYGFSINSAATDLAGNSLDPELEVTFTTARRWDTAIYVDTDMSKFVFSDGTVGGDGFVNMTVNRVGDNEANRGIRSFISYPLAELPAEIIALEHAQLHMLDWNQTGFPVVADNSGLGSLLVHDVSFAEILSTTYNLELGVEAGTMMSWQSGEVPVDVTDILLADIDADASYSQFRLSWSKTTNLNSVPDFFGVADEDLPLELTVLIP